MPRRPSPPWRKTLCAAQAEHRQGPRPGNLRGGLAPTHPGVDLAAPISHLQIPHTPEVPTKWSTSTPPPPHTERRAGASRRSGRWSACRGWQSAARPLCSPAPGATRCRSAPGSCPQEGRPPRAHARARGWPPPDTARACAAPCGPRCLRCEGRAGTRPKRGAAPRWIGRGGRPATGGQRGYGRMASETGVATSRRTSGQSCPTRRRLVVRQGAWATGSSCARRVCGVDEWPTMSHDRQKARMAATRHRASSQACAAHPAPDARTMLERSRGAAIHRGVSFHR